MRSGKRGKHISKPEVTNVSPHGLWLLVDGHEHFLPFAKFPWFADATIRDVTRVEMSHAGHLHWPALDVDLSIDSIERPDAFPLADRVRESPTRRKSPRSRRTPHKRKS